MNTGLENRSIGRRSLFRNMRRSLHAYLFISPFYLFFAVFMGFPVLFSVYISLFKWRGTGQRTFVGLANYRLLLLDPDIRAAIWNTIYIWVGHLAPLLVMGLVLAVILNSPRIRGYKFFRGIYFLPNITSVVIVALLFAALLGYEYGVVNLVITWLGGEKVKWLGSARWSKISIIVMILWQWTGYFMVMMLAGLQAIPRELYDAASVDGASPIQAFLHITIPLMAPVIVFIVITSTFSTFQTFAEPFILTMGGPGNSSMTVGLYIYWLCFKYFKFGYGAAIAYTIGIFTFVLALLQWRVSRRYFT